MLSKFVATEEEPFVFKTNNIVWYWTAIKFNLNFKSNGMVLQTGYVSTDQEKKKRKKWGVDSFQNVCSILCSKQQYSKEISENFSF